MNWEVLSACTLLIWRLREVQHSALGPRQGNGVGRVCIHSGLSPCEARDSLRLRQGHWERQLSPLDTAPKSRRSHRTFTLLSTSQHGGSTYAGCAGTSALDFPCLDFQLSSLAGTERLDSSDRESMLSGLPGQRTTWEVLPTSNQGGCNQSQLPTGAWLLPDPGLPDHAADSSPLASGPGALGWLALWQSCSPSCPAGSRRSKGFLGTHSLDIFSSLLDDPCFVRFSRSPLLPHGILRPEACCVEGGKQEGTYSPQSAFIFFLDPLWGRFLIAFR